MFRESFAQAIGLKKPEIPCLKNLVKIQSHLKLAMEKYRKQIARLPRREKKTSVLHLKQAKCPQELLD
jgi:hypothetical protein